MVKTSHYSDPIVSCWLDSLVSYEDVYVYSVWQGSNIKHLRNLRFILYFKPKRAIVRNGKANGLADDKLAHK